MKRKLLLSLLPLLLSTLSVSAAQRFNGKWEGSYDNSESGSSSAFFLELTQNSDFSLHLTQINKHTLSGNYCYVTQTRDDCPDYGDPENVKSIRIHGTVSGKIANVFFAPFPHSKKQGRAILKLNHDILLWYIISDPKYHYPITYLPRIYLFSKTKDPDTLAAQSRYFYLKKGLS